MFAGERFPVTRRSSAADRIECAHDARRIDWPIRGHPRMISRQPAMVALVSRVTAREFT